MSEVVNKNRHAYVAFGLQSGGSTIISYCFLQRGDMTGVLDWFHDRLPEPPRESTQKQWWCKCTIASFSAVEVITYLEELGWDVTPLLIIRDVRYAMDSLATRTYGRNATTAEDPPLRIRLKRFLADWEYFCENNLPIIRFEDFTHEPEVELKKACDGMGLPWDKDMVRWPKSRDAVWGGGGGNQNFINSISAGLYATMKDDQRLPQIKYLPRGELNWLNRVFRTYNQVNNYPLELDENIIANCVDGELVPDLANASRYPRMRRNQLIYRFVPLLARIRRRLAVK